MCPRPVRRRTFAVPHAPDELGHVIVTILELARHEESRRLEAGKDVPFLPVPLRKGLDEADELLDVGGADPLLHPLRDGGRAPALRPCEKLLPPVLAELRCAACAPGGELVRWFRWRDGAARNDRPHSLGMQLSQAYAGTDASRVAPESDRVEPEMVEELDEVDREAIEMVRRGPARLVALAVAAMVEQDARIRLASGAR